MGTAELVLRIASTGAVGVACLALYLWHRSYGDLVRFASDRRTQGDATQLTVLSQQLAGYQKMMVGALVASVLVQVATPLLDKIGSRIHRVTVAVQPMDETLMDYMPELRHESQPLTPLKPGVFEVAVDKSTNFDVNVLKLRDLIHKLNASHATSIAALKEKQTGLQPLGF